MTDHAIEYCQGSAAFGGLRWANCGELQEQFIAMAMACHKLSREQIMARLDAREAVHFGTEWNETLRVRAPAAATARVAAERCTCTACGDTLPMSRFTTLPLSASTCDDCA